jgi:hypothetical protein
MALGIALERFGADESTGDSTVLAILIIGHRCLRSHWPRFAATGMPVTSTRLASSSIAGAARIVTVVAVIMAF